ncbi:hypothetical protein SAMN05444673_6392 [Bacillus sp. OV166]|nr:hypothetical protein SAMN05444673_6392 [Bacillus sp. OV166]
MIRFFLIHMTLRLKDLLAKLIQSKWNTVYNLKTLSTLTTI